MPQGAALLYKKNASYTVGRRVVGGSLFRHVFKAKENVEISYTLLDAVSMASMPLVFAVVSFSCENHNFIIFKASVFPLGSPITVSMKSAIAFFVGERVLFLPLDERASERASAWATRVKFHTHC